MYGIVNKSIEELIEKEFGEDEWLKDIESINFLSHEQYDDSITYRLVKETALFLNTTQQEVLIKFGHYWILNTGLEKYGALMWSGGKQFDEFMMNLPSFHTRIMLMYPDLVPPEFLVTESNGKLLVEYHSERPGLTYFVYGLLEGLATMFKISIKIDINQKKENQNYDLFTIKWS